jgi:hypothetical protein
MCTLIVQMTVILIITCCLQKLGRDCQQANKEHKILVCRFIAGWLYDAWCIGSLTKQDYVPFVFEMTIAQGQLVIKIRHLDRHHHKLEFYSLVSLLTAYHQQILSAQMTKKCIHHQLMFLYPVISNNRGQRTAVIQQCLHTFCVPHNTRRRIRHQVLAGVWVNRGTGINTELKEGLTVIFI